MSVVAPVPVVAVVVAGQPDRAPGVDDVAASGQAVEPDQRGDACVKPGGDLGERIAGLHAISRAAAAGRGRDGDREQPDHERNRGVSKGPFAGVRKQGAR